MRDVTAYGRLCQRELDALGIPYSKRVEFRRNDRAKKRFGVCRKFPDGHFVIEISGMLLEDDAPEKSLRQVIHHELLHTVPGCGNHGGKWKGLADIVNAAYGYRIQRTDRYEDLGLTEPETSGEKAEPKYLFVCTGCGQRISRYRQSKFTKNYRSYRCGKCGGTFRKVL